MNEQQYYKAWSEFWRRPEVDSMPPTIHQALVDLIDVPGHDFLPPIVGFSKTSQCYIVAWVDLGDAVFDIAYFLDGKAGWYFRDGDKIDATHADPPNYVDWNEVPHAPLERFKICLEVTDDA